MSTNDAMSNIDWLYQEPFIGELKKRIDSFGNNEEKMFSLEEIDKEFDSVLILSDSD